MQILKPVLLAGGLIASAAAWSETPLPAELTAEDLAGAIFERPDVEEIERDGRTILDVTSLKSSDGRFASGMYRAGKSRFEITEPYGVDEFMYFLEGSVTLTSPLLSLAM